MATVIPTDERESPRCFVGPICSTSIGPVSWPSAISTRRRSSLSSPVGYSAQVGYAVGAIFDFAKALLPVALLVLLARRAFPFFGVIGSRAAAANVGGDDEDNLANLSIAVPERAATVHKVGGSFLSVGRAERLSLVSITS